MVACHCRLLLVLAGSVVLTLTISSQMAQAQRTVSFETQIKPLLERHCLRCHGPENQEGDFRIDDREAVLSAYVEAGDAEFSDLYLYISSEDQDELMPPPDEGGPLPAGDIALVKTWIDEGADWPESVQLTLVAEVVQEVETQVAEEQKAADVQAGNFQLFTEIAGLLHPVLLHFPVALLIGGALFALLGFRGESPLADAAYYSLWLGAWMAILACISGWYFAVDKNMASWQIDDFNNLKSIDIHRWGGILVAVLAFLLALVAASSRRRDPYGTGAFWKLGMLLLAALTGYVAHFGGKMTHDGLHEKLFNKSNQLYQNLTGEAAVAPAEAPDTEDKAAADKEAASDDEFGDESGSSEPAATGQTSAEADGQDDAAGKKDDEPAVGGDAKETTRPAAADESSGSDDPDEGDDKKMDGSDSGDG
jgi:uncharacterized membrane protein